MLFWYDCDLKGNDSVRKALATGPATHIKCPSYTVFDKAVREVLPHTGPDDLHVIDTLTNLLETTRSDAKLGTDVLNTDLWDKRGKYLEGDPQYLNVYQLAQQFIMRRLVNITARDARLLVVCHEMEQRDPRTFTNVKLPGVNPALVDVLVGRSSDVFYLRTITEDIMDPENPGVIACPCDTRVLYLRPDETRPVIKYGVDIDRSTSIPRRIVNPSLPELYEVLGKKMSWGTIYGAPGAGKTTLAFSEITGKIIPGAV